MALKDEAPIEECDLGNLKSKIDIESLEAPFKWLLPAQNRLQWIET